MSQTIGHYEIGPEIARGGMGVVHAATHRVERRAVALKILLETGDMDPAFHEDFRREVQSSARLTHRHVVTVYDYGRIRESEAVAGRPVNAPYLAMQLADGGSLEDRPPADWPELARVLDQLLLALGHAHARGVIHRDLKPGNVLLHRGRAAVPRVLLADFGIAHASDRRYQPEQDALERMAGTPAYMAPEQVECRWRDFGPWTDLYALGIIVYQFVSGQLPYRHPTMLATLMAHVIEPMPPLEPRFAIPDGLAAWVARLCAKDIDARFVCAADARRALESLDAGFVPSSEAEPQPEPAAGPREAAPWAASGPSSGTPPWVASGPSSEAPPWVASGPSSGAPPWVASGPAPVASPPPWAANTAHAVAPVISQEGAVAVGLSSRAADLETPSADVPADWRDPEAEVSEPLHGAGLDLFSLRDVPMVGRERERDRAWSALRAVVSERRARALLVRGASGTGKSRFARWLCERAPETAAVTVIHTAHEPTPGPAQGLPRMLATRYDAIGLRSSELHDWLMQRLRREGLADGVEAEAEALAAMIEGVNDARSAENLRFASPRERAAAVSGVVRRAARRGAVVVWLDDVQWGSESVAWVRDALDELDAPVLFVVAVRDEALAERPRESQLVAELTEHERSEVIPIGRLSGDATRELVEGLLGLSGEVASRVRRRVQGNPMFAVQIVGDWVQRGVLQLGPRGFSLRAGEKDELADELHEVWGSRIARILRDFPKEASEPLELAAVLGLAHDDDELDAVCEAWGATIDESVLEALLRAHLIERSPGGFAFSHGMLRESLVRTAEEAGRAERMHRLCADVLGRLGGRGVEVRRGHHLTRAGDLDAAVDVLLRAAEELREESDYAAALDVLGQREEILARLALPTDDLRWGRGWALRADLHRLEWDFDAAHVWATNAESSADAPAWRSIRAEALIVLAHVARHRGELDEGLALNRRAFELFHRLDDDDGKARALLATAIIARQRGELDKAVDLYARAYALFDLAGNDRGAGNGLLGLALVAGQRGNGPTAASKYASALERFERAGHRAGVANCYLGSADVDRGEGRLAEAETKYRRALVIQQSIGSKASLFARLNLALVLSSRGRHGEAREALEREIPALERAKKQAYLDFVHAVLLPSLAHLGDLEAFDHHLARAQAGAEARRLVDGDMAAAAREAAGVLREGGHEARAHQTFELAAALYDAVGDEAEAAAARAEIGA